MSFFAVSILVLDVSDLGQLSLDIVLPLCKLQALIVGFLHERHQIRKSRYILGCLGQAAAVDIEVEVVIRPRSPSIIVVLELGVLGINLRRESSSIH
jgi:hypothetical protein